MLQKVVVAITER